MFQKIVLLGVAGSFGAIVRFGISSLMNKIIGHPFPFGTIAVNLIGCFLIGIIWALAESKFELNEHLKIIILIGFLGAFTTFSTYILETSHMFNSGNWHWALFNIFGQNLLGILIFFGGLKLGKVI